MPLYSFAALDFDSSPFVGPQAARHSGSIVFRVLHEDEVTEAA